MQTPFAHQVGDWRCLVACGGGGSGSSISQAGMQPVSLWGTITPSAACSSTGSLFVSGRQLDQE